MQAFYMYIQKLCVCYFSYKSMHLHVQGCSLWMLFTHPEVFYSICQTIILFLETQICTIKCHKIWKKNTHIFSPNHTETKRLKMCCNGSMWVLYVYIMLTCVGCPQMVVMAPRVETLMGHSRVEHTVLPNNSFALVWI